MTPDKPPPWVQGDLLGEPGAPYVRGSDTSLGAALSVLPALRAMEREVFDALASNPSTGDELEVRLGMLHQTVGARLRGLVLKGMVRDTGRRRATRSGRQAAVWEIVPQVR